jgi:UDP-N-acetylglucosamine 4,6-dehydratase
MVGGEIFIPKISSMNIMDLAKIIAPECRTEYIGIRPGEKLHEVMIASDDSRNTLEFEDYYIIKPDFDWWDNKNHLNGKPVPEGFSYASNTNLKFLSEGEMKELIKDFR